MKRILLFVMTNLAVVAVLGVVASLLGVNRYLTANGLNLGALLGFALVMGFGGAIISLLRRERHVLHGPGRRGVRHERSELRGVPQRPAVHAAHGGRAVPGQPDGRWQRWRRVGRERGRRRGRGR